jgi:membrane carboxypeptidase/penicillin-binding protein
MVLHVLFQQFSLALLFQVFKKQTLWKTIQAKRDLVTDQTIKEAKDKRLKAEAIVNQNQDQAQWTIAMVQEAMVNKVQWGSISQRPYNLLTFENRNSHDLVTGVSVYIYFL